LIGFHDPFHCRHGVTKPGADEDSSQQIASGH
jgi:hypothetical protein